MQQEMQSMINQNRCAGHDVGGTEDIGGVV